MKTIAVFISPFFLALFFFPSFTFPISKFLFKKTSQVSHVSNKTELTSNILPTTKICDNGGFEQDFLHYLGFVSTYSLGSDDCDPQYSPGNNSAFSSTPLPTANRFEIVTSGIDTLVGIQKTKFGSKSLRLNNRYGHHDQCEGNIGIDRISKEFEVTLENRQFTIWYAVVLENPSDHINSQPFFSIKCDLAPDSDLCFDAEVLSCEDVYADSAAVCSFDSIDVLDWTCHTIVIPESEIGETAILEITVADCGVGAHFGYAYIDGICEDCIDGSDGSVKLFEADTCYFDSTICGMYSLPNLCDLTWSLLDISVPGYTIDSLEIDSFNKTFCFEFSRSNIEEDSCHDVVAKARFVSNLSDTSIKYSNAIVICDSFYNYYYKDFSTSICYDNVPSGSSDNNNISDDHYYVNITIQNTYSSPWGIFQQLDEPYPNESGYRELASGSSDQVLQLGPFLIQEGSWEMTIIVDSCTYTEQITPPDYCSGCSEFYGIIIENIECDDLDDTWSFDITVPGSGTYNIVGPGTPTNPLYTKGTKYSIAAGDILTECQEYTLSGAGIDCVSDFIICPPKPCSTSCTIQSIIEEITCEVIGGTTYFSIDLEVSKNQAGHLCYSVVPVGGGNPSIGSLTGSQILGPYTEDVFVTIYLCSNSDCTTGCATPTCFKTFYVALPICDELEQMISPGGSNVASSAVKLYPNPLLYNYFTILSEIQDLEFDLIDANGKILLRDQVESYKQQFNVILPKGIYYIRYKDKNNMVSILKLTKI